LGILKNTVRLNLFLLIAFFDTFSRDIQSKHVH
jgi:hypothetical protein